MESDIPSELDISTNLITSCASYKSSELQDTLVTTRDSLIGAESELISRILQVLRVRIIQTRDLTLGIAIPLQGICHIVLFRREDSRIRNPGG